MPERSSILDRELHPHAKEEFLAEIAYLKGENILMAEAFVVEVERASSSGASRISVLPFTNTPVSAQR